MAQYCNAIEKELALRLSKWGKHPPTLYIGGGTPSIVPLHLLKSFLDSSKLSIESGITREFTIEANPESVNLSWLEGTRELGVNRLSLGVQALDDTLLRNLGRIHTAEEAYNTFTMARGIGFPTISVDLMFGIPGQTIAAWEKTLNEVISWNPDHISCYSLNIEEDTVYFDKMIHQELMIPGAEEVEDMFVIMVDKLTNAGFIHYEISNFALPGKECRHNIGYWEYIPYWGIGASAHSFDGIKRWWNEREPEKYIQKILSAFDATDDYEIIDSEKYYRERLMLSLRMRKGLNFDLLHDLPDEKRGKLHKKIDVLVDHGYMEFAENDRVRFTLKGALLVDEITSELLVILES